MWAVLAILTQALVFLLLSAFGITALLAASTAAFSVAKILGAVFLIFLGVRGWMNATVAPKENVRIGSIMAGHSQLRRSMRSLWLVT